MASLRCRAGRWVVLSVCVGLVLAGAEVYGIGKGPEAAFSLGTVSTVAGAGNLYIADGENSGTLEVHAESKRISTLVPGVWGAGVVAVDDEGNIYFSEPILGLVKKMNAATGDITTVAGQSFTGGYSGDGGPATKAGLSDPTGVAVDSSGNIYIADPQDNVIREVNAATGVITTVAGSGMDGYSGDGGPATKAELNYPSSVAVDGAGNLYFGDVLNHRVREVNAATGVITTVAGNGGDGYNGDGGPATKAILSDPAGVAVDAAGNLYIADAGNNVIREVNAATGVITTVAGNGTKGYSGDGGPATSAELSGPAGVAVEGAGNLYIADTGNHRIRKVGVMTSSRSFAPTNGGT